MIHRFAGLGLLLCVTGVGAAEGQGVPDSLPPGVTADMIGTGKTLFGGVGICLTCHGPDATGVEGLGPNLTDDEWLHSQGGYDEIVAQITEGISADKSTNGLVMPPRGGGLNDEQVRAVAAYVWSLSHGGGGGAP